MNKKIKMVFLSMLILYGASLNAKELINQIEHIQKARLSLKRYGFASCIGNSDKSEVQNEAGQAAGAYFQLGNHDDEAAYKSVRDFFKKMLSNVRTVSQFTGKPIIIMHCLKAYDSKKYQELIERQDQYIDIIINGS